MKKLILTSFLFLLTFYIFSQCNPSIPSNAVVISSTQTIGFGSAQLWVCPNDSLTTNGGSEYIYLESGAYVLTNGGSNFVWVPQGAKVNTPSGGNTIYYVDPADLVYTGSATLIQCSSINYDYSNAPSNGCQMTTGVIELKNSFDIQIFPNPSNGVITISSSEILKEVEIVDVLGNSVFKKTMNSKLETLNILQPKGIYFIKLNSEKEIFTKKIIIH